jgi:hypothetical protein|tara:strand:+ start:393 stop:773 length:381 start_codon:yes stop_codon:yes gene_type:complete
VTAAAKEIDIEELMIKLLDRTATCPDDDGSESIMRAALLDQADLIREIGQACEKTVIYQSGIDRFTEHKSEFDACHEPCDRLLNAWRLALHRVVYAPTQLHRKAAVRLCMPLVACYLPSEASRGVH